MPFTHILADELIEYIRANYASVWIGAYTALPNKSGGGTEVVGGSYARIELDTDVIFPASSSSETASGAQVAFPTPTATWGSIVAWTMHDASSAGDLLAWYQLPTPRFIGSGDNVAFPIGNLIIRNV